MYELKDSGNRQTFGSGAQRDREVGKGRYDLVTPLAMKRLADIWEKGSLKYSARNWEKGMPLSRYVDSAMRHLFQFLEGRRDEDHAGQSAWNLLCLIHTEECINRGLLPKELNDLPNYLCANTNTSGRISSTNQNLSTATAKRSQKKKAGVRPLRKSAT